MILPQTLGLSFTNVGAGAENFSYDFGANTVIQILSMTSESPCNLITIGTSTTDTGGVVNNFFRGTSLAISDGVAIGLNSKINVVSRYLRLTIDQGAGDTFTIVMTVYPIPSTDDLAAVVLNAKGNLAASTPAQVVTGVDGRRITIKNIIFVADAVASTCAASYVNGVNVYPYAQTTINNVSSVIGTSLYPIVLNTADEKLRLESDQNVSYFVSYINEAA